MRSGITSLVGISKPGLAARDTRVFDWCRTRDLPLAIAMAGGYAENIDDIVDIHFSTVCQAFAHHTGPKDLA